MGSYADATAEITRLNGLEGVQAVRDAVTETTAAGAAGDNLVLVKDSRITDEDRASHAVTNGDREPLAGHGAWLIYEVGSSATYPNSVTTHV